MKKVLIFTVIFIFTGFNVKSESLTVKNKKPQWAIKFADAVMARYDSMIYYQRKKPKYEYDYALLGSAIARLENYDQKYLDYMQDYIDYFVHEDGTIDGYKMSDYNIDRVRPGFNMLTLYEKTGDKKYKLAAQTLVKQMEIHPRTKSNGYWHKKRYPWQMWLDGIYMASPFLVRYASIFNEPKWYNEVVNQITLIYGKTRDPETGLVYHAWDESREQRWSDQETGQSKHFWSRGTGWYMMALVDVLDYLPANHSGRDSIVDILNNLSQSLLKVQDPQTGLWYQVMEYGGKEGNYLEASGSAMIIYAFAKGANNGYLPAKYRRIASNAFDNMVKTMVEQGEDGYPVLTNTCGACGLGGDPYREGDYEYYISEKKVDNDQKGVGPFIMAAIELNK